MREIKVGDTVKIGGILGLFGKKYICVENEDIFSAQCRLCDLSHNKCRDIVCSYYQRKDGNSVYFVEVKE